MATPLRISSETRSIIRAGLTALCLTTALYTPSLNAAWAAGRGGINVSVGGTVGSVGGAVGGVGGAGGGIGGGVGGIGGGISSGGGVSIGGVTVGRGGVSNSGGAHFTGSNFFSGGVDFGNGAAHRPTRGLDATGNRITRHTNRNSTSRRTG